MVWFELAAPHAVLSNRVFATRLDRCNIAFAPRGVRIGNSARTCTKRGDMGKMRSPSRHRSPSPNESAGRPCVMSPTAAMAPSSQAASKGAEDLNRWTFANDWAVAYRKYSRALRR
jgi:hypothetical protein